MPAGVCSRAHPPAARSGERLLPCFEHQVERRLGGAAEALETRLGEHASQTRFASLCAEAEAYLLSERARRTNKGRECVHHASDGVGVLLERVVGEGLDEKHSATRLERLMRVTHCADRIAHVVE